VNNCAAAMVLALNALAQRKEVPSRGEELVEIGGSFRIPDIMARSGAKLVEVGTTNRTHDDDYRRALPKDSRDREGASHNFAIEGFHVRSDCRSPDVHCRRARLAVIP